MNNPFLDNDNSTKELKGLVISEQAIKRLETIFSQNTDKSVFRITIKGGGCSGFQYTFDMDTQTSDNDFIIEKQLFTVACDKNSLELIDGGEVDFIDSLTGQYFTINNPNATANCGCGTSFSI